MQQSCSHSNNVNSACRSLNKLFQIPRVQNLVKFSSFLFHFVAEGWRVCRDAHFLSRNFPIPQFFLDLGATLNLGVDDRYRSDEKKVTAEARWAVLIQNYMFWGAAEWRERSSQSWKRKRLLWGVKLWNGVIISWGGGSIQWCGTDTRFQQRGALKALWGLGVPDHYSQLIFQYWKTKITYAHGRKCYHGNNDICCNLEIAAAHLWRNFFTVSGFFLYFSIWFYFSTGFNQWHKTDAHREGAGDTTWPPGCKGTTSWSTKQTETVRSRSNQLSL